jgi:L-alanine-DL-glutamate epimerase-like enolase superfamily enzyme
MQQTLSPSCPADAGGLLAARKSAAIAEAAGLPVFLHSNIELGVATAAHLHLAASLPNCHYASQTEHQFLSGDVVAQGDIDHNGGSYAVPQGPGLGVEVDEELVRKYHDVYVQNANQLADTADPAVTSLPGY